MKRSGMGGFVGDVCALLGVEGLRDAVKVKALLTELLEKWVTKTDSAMLLVAIKPVYLPLLSVRAVNSEVPW